MNNENNRTYTITIFGYSDYRNFIRDWYLQKNKENPKISHRWINQQMGWQSSGSFAGLIALKIHINYDRIDRFIKLLKLTNLEGEYFTNSVYYAKSKDEIQKNNFHKKMDDSKLLQMKLNLQYFKNKIGDDYMSNEKRSEDIFSMYSDIKNLPIDVQYGLKDYLENYFPKLIKEIETITKTNFTFIINWLSLPEIFEVKDNNFIEIFTRSTFHPIISAFKTICRDEIGTTILTQNVKKIEINFSSSCTANLQNGTLSLHFCNHDYVQDCADKIIALIEQYPPSEIVKEGINRIDRNFIYRYITLTSSSQMLREMEWKLKKFDLIPLITLGLSNGSHVRGVLIKIINQMTEPMECIIRTEEETVVYVNSRSITFVEFREPNKYIEFLSEGHLEVPFSPDNDLNNKNYVEIRRKASGISNKLTEKWPSAFTTSIQWGGMTHDIRCRFSLWKMLEVIEAMMDDLLLNYDDTIVSFKFNGFEIQHSEEKAIKLNGGIIIVCINTLDGSVGRFEKEELTKEVFKIHSSLNQT